MASLQKQTTKYKDDGPRWKIQLNHKGRRPVIRLGKMTEKSARSILTHVERLDNAAIDRQPLPRDTAEWLGSIGDDLHAKLVKAGVAEPRKAAVVAILAKFIDGYIKARTDLKERSRANLIQARNGLVNHFGESRELRTITKGEMGDWHRGIKSRLSKATCAGHVKRARMFFADARNRNLIDESPMVGIKAGSMANRDRFVYVPVETAKLVIDACPDAEWRLIFALARYAGLRVPSEIRSLDWPDIDWDQHRMIVRAIKTEHHVGGGVRTVPIVPELMTYLREVWEQAKEGARHVIVKHRGENLRTMAEKIIARAGVEQWVKIFQNLRSSCETDLTSRFPLHVACAWIGNSEAVAMQHYLQVTDRHFTEATGKGVASGVAEAAGNLRNNLDQNAENPPFSGLSRTISTPKGIRPHPRFSLENSGISRAVLRRALHRIKIASPYLFRTEIAKLRQQGGVF